MTDLERIFLEKLIENDSVTVFDFIGTGIDKSNIDQISSNVANMLETNINIEYIGVN